MLTVVVAMMYLATSSTALLHALSHAPLAGERSCAAEGEASPESVSQEPLSFGSDSPDAASLENDRRCSALDAAIELDAPGCFFCHHGPAVAVVVAPSVAPAPSMLPGAITSVSATQAHSALRILRPSLRAPPFAS
ncbi:MAG TPA: hypothetical protein VNA88_15505 [Candidatus Kapabacteria bacterium]|nr:hypothetical protein [Candidatus Kapabacteria bacterium]